MGDFFIFDKYFLRPTYVLALLGVNDQCVTFIDEERGGDTESGFQLDHLAAGGNSVALDARRSFDDFQSHLDRQFDVDRVAVKIQNRDFRAFDQIVSRVAETLGRKGELFVGGIIHEGVAGRFLIQELRFAFGDVRFFDLVSALKSLFQHRACDEIFYPGPEHRAGASSLGLLMVEHCVRRPFENDILPRLDVA